MPVVVLPPKSPLLLALKFARPVLPCKFNLQLLHPSATSRCQFRAPVSAGLLFRALERGSKVDPLFDMSGVATASLKTESWGYDEAKARAFARMLRERMEATPGGTHVSFMSSLPLQGAN